MAELRAVGQHLVVASVFLGPDGECAVTVSIGWARVWRLTDGKIVRRLHHLHAHACRRAQSANGRRFVGFGCISCIDIHIYFEISIELKRGACYINFSAQTRMALRTLCSPEAAIAGVR
eukprot:4797947-Pleurochrysis_carterae.AAC.4